MTASPDLGLVREVRGLPDNRQRLRTTFALLFLPVVARCPLIFVQPFVPVRAEKGPSAHRPWAEAGQRACTRARLVLAKGVAATYVHGSLRKKSDPGNQHAAITARTDADDGRANALVRRYSALGVTEPLI